MMIDEAYLYKYMPAAERILLAALPADEDLNHKFSRRFERKMKALIKNVGRTPAERKFYSGMRIAFVAIAITILIAFGSAMSVKASRHCIIEFLIEVFTDKTEYSVKDEKPEGVTVVPVEPGYVPEGYEVTRRVNNPTEYFVCYENSYGDRLRYNQAVAGADARFWDTEVSITDEVKIGKMSVRVIEADAMLIVYWEAEEYIYSILGIGNISVEELMKIARSVIKECE